MRKQNRFGMLTVWSLVVGIAAGFMWAAPADAGIVPGLANSLSSDTAWSSPLTKLPAFILRFSDTAGRSAIFVASTVVPTSALASAKEKKEAAPKTPAAITTTVAPAKGQAGQPSMAEISAAKATLTTPETYRYTSVGKTDPFKPFMELEVKPFKVKAKAIPLSPLQRLDVEQYILVGIAGNNQGRAAMVEDRKDKKFYPLFVGTSIGQNNGRVIEILADRVIVEEKRTNAKAKRIVLLLHREEVKP